MIDLPTVIVRIRRDDLIAHGACVDGLALFDSIAHAQGNPKRVRMRWSMLAQFWLATSSPSFARWLREKGLLPPVYAASGADLSRADLSRANLSRAYLSGADLSGVNLSRAHLSRAHLSRADLSGANFSGADLSGANLSRAYLSGANLSGANLSRAYLSGADLETCFWSKSRPPPDGWSHDPPLTDRDWVMLRRVST